MSEAFQKFYEACLKLVSDLAAMDPAPDSPEGRMLLELSAAMEEYEKSAIDAGVVQKRIDQIKFRTGLDT